MTGELIELQVSAVRYACGQMTALHLKALHDSIEQACRIPAAFWVGPQGGGARRNLQRAGGRGQ